MHRGVSSPYCMIETPTATRILWAGVMDCPSRLQHHAVPRQMGIGGVTRPFCWASNQTGSFISVCSRGFAASTRTTFSKRHSSTGTTRWGAHLPGARGLCVWKRDRSVLARRARLFGEQGFVELRVWGACWLMLRQRMGGVMDLEQAALERHQQAGPS